MGSSALNSIVSKHRHGDVEILMQYVDSEPAMLVRAANFLNRRRSAWVIKESAAWKYVDNVESPVSGHSAHMIASTVKIASMLGLSQDIKSRFNIAEAILNHLEDLIRMKPLDEKDAGPDGGHVEGSMTVGGEVVDISSYIPPDLINSTDGMQQVSNDTELKRKDI